jgi:anti-sigma factor RsiW
MKRRSRELVCRQLVEKVSAYLDGDLGTADRDAVERHLEACDDCAGYVAQVRRLLELTAVVGGVTLPPDVVDDLTRRFRIQGTWGGRF